MDGLDGLVGGSRLVGIFDAEKELSTMMSGEKPVEKSRSGAADVKETGGRGGETGNDGHGLI